MWNVDPTLWIHSVSFRFNNIGGMFPNYRVSEQKNVNVIQVEKGCLDIIKTFIHC